MTNASNSKHRCRHRHANWAGTRPYVLRLERKAALGTGRPPQSPSLREKKKTDMPRRRKRHMWARVGTERTGTAASSPPDVTKTILTYSFMSCFQKAVNRGVRAENTKQHPSGTACAEPRATWKKNVCDGNCRQNPC